MALTRALVNGSFEQPTVTSPSKYQLFSDASQTADPNHVPGWLTTGRDHKIEIWKSGMLGVSADDGVQFAELNATEVGGGKGSEKGDVEEQDAVHIS